MAVPKFGEFRGGKFWTFWGLASPGLCHLLGVASLGLSHFKGLPVHNFSSQLFRILTQGNLRVARRIRHPVCTLNRVFDPSCYPQMCQNPEINKSPEIATLRTCHPQKMAVPNSGEFRGGKFWTLPCFWGWQVLDLIISEGGQFITVFFLILAHREIWGWQE